MDVIHDRSSSMSSRGSTLAYLGAGALGAVSASLIGSFFNARHTAEFKSHGLKQLNTVADGRAAFELFPMQMGTPRRLIFEN
jgi:hypothetical protein